ncbi:hypothetical protein HDU83_005380 [Entophlyctis luteolus]|nr:hypothetical protein HDU83_005380 [Entophlyctis luteolus]
MLTNEEKKERNKTKKKKKKEIMGIGKKYKKPQTQVIKPADANCNQPPPSSHVDARHLASEKLPRAFRIAMNLKQRMAKPRTASTNHSQSQSQLESPSQSLPLSTKNHDRANGTSQKARPQLPKRKPNESIYEFNQRVENEIRASVNKAARAQTKTAIKRKQRLSERKQRRDGKNRGDIEEVKEFAIAEQIPFGVQVDAPPRFTVVPKKVGGGAGARRVLEQQMSDEGQNSGDPVQVEERDEKAKPDTTAALRKVGRKTKLKHLPMVKQKQLAEERAKAIEVYRMAKTKNVGKPSKG